MCVGFTHKEVHAGLGPFDVSQRWGKWSWAKRSACVIQTLYGVHGLVIIKFVNL